MTKPEQNRSTRLSKRRKKALNSTKFRRIILPTFTVASLLIVFMVAIIVPVFFTNDKGEVSTEELEKALRTVSGRGVINNLNYKDTKNNASFEVKKVIQKKGETSFEGLTINLKSTGGILTSKSAQMENSKKRLNLRGGVQYSDKSGLSLKSDSIDADLDKGILSGDGGITGSIGKIKVLGDSYKYHTKSQQLLLEGNIKIIIDR